MSGVRITTSRWFVLASSGLLVLLCLGVLLAALLLMQRSLQPRIGQVIGSSMEPTLAGPRWRLPCPNCAFENFFAVDSVRTGQLVACQCCAHPIETDSLDRQQSGQRVRYVPRFAWSRNWSWNRTEIPNSIGRWDRAVIRRGPGQPSEIKRVVGLPGESVTIHRGDLWIDGKRPRREPMQFLQQAVLVSHWTPSSSPRGCAQWLRSLPSSLDNRLSLNAHDSHAIAEANDVGLSLRMSPSEPPWMLELVVNGPSPNPTTLRIESLPESTRMAWSTPRDLGSSSIAPWRSDWIQILCIDDRLVLCDHDSQRWALPTALQDPPLEKNSSSTEEADSRALFAASILHGEIHFDRGLLYRGIVYRGYADAAEQEFPAAEGYLVLGDNVSISNDSRGAGLASERIAEDAIRGILLPPAFPLENLLHQADAMPGDRCPSTHLRNHREQGPDIKPAQDANARRP